jgi:cell division protein FtsZ
VATGIEAEHVAQLPPNVEQLRPRARGTAQTITKPEARPVASPVHSRVEALAQEMNAMVAGSAPATPAQAAPAAEAMTLRTPEPPTVDDAPELVPEPTRIQPTSAARPAPQAQPQLQRRGPFGLFGARRKTEPPRAEPQMAPAAAPYPSRTAAEPLGRNAQSTAAPPSDADDLFADHKKDDFEIPAFLRRQSN